MHLISPAILFIFFLAAHADCPPTGNDGFIKLNAAAESTFALTKYFDAMSAVPAISCLSHGTKADSSCSAIYLNNDPKSNSCVMLTALHCITNCLVDPPPGMNAPVFSTSSNWESIVTYHRIRQDKIHSLNLNIRLGSHATDPVVKNVKVLTTGYGWIEVDPNAARHDHENKEIMAATMGRFGSSADYAVLEIPGMTCPSCLSFSKDEPNVGSTISAIGFPGGISVAHGDQPDGVSQFLSMGKALAPLSTKGKDEDELYLLSDFFDKNLILYSGALTHGNSGGAFVQEKNSRAMLVGLVTGGIEYSKELSGAGLKSSYILNQIKTTFWKKQQEEILKCSK